MIASCVLIVNEEIKKFLAVSLKWDHSDMNFPGGKVEENETVEEAGIREVKEETGLNIKNLVKLYSAYDGDWKVVTYYTNDYTGYINTKENHKIEWLPLEDMCKSKSWPKYNTSVYNEYIKSKQIIYVK